MTLTTGTAGPLLTPEQVEDLLVLPVLAASVALNPLVSTVVRLTGSTYRIPKVTADPSAAWVAEGAEIPVSDLTTNELVVTPSKVAGLSVITSELAEDSSPEASTEVGAGLARDIARKVDAAFFRGVAAAPSRRLPAETHLSNRQCPASMSSLSWDALLGSRGELYNGEDQADDC